MSSGQKHQLQASNVGAPPQKKTKSAEPAAPYTIKHTHAGPNPPRIRPRHGEGVYPVRSIAESKTGQGQSDLAPLDHLAVEIVKSQQISLSTRYTHVMYKEDCRTPTSAKSDDGDDDNVATPEETDADAQGSNLRNLDPTVPPIHTLSAIYDKIAEKLTPLNFSIACSAFANKGLRVFTMCSGTESPLLAMNMLNDALIRKAQPGLVVDHLASAEIEPFKQAYIQRNFEPKVLFRDVTEFIKEEKQAHTAFGGLAPQPQDVHMLIAGSSCIDYSSLNNKKKSFGEDGQSYETFVGVAAYAERYRPAVVILENVSGAPWEKIRDYYDDMGYYAVVMFVDSKDFYIPQTRRRGYMVAFDRKRAMAIGLDLKMAASTLISSVEKLSQRASSPYPDFIFQDDDRELELARREISESSRGNNTDWVACRLRYAAFRVLNMLGTGRPATFWRNGGKSQCLDYMWSNWSAMQRERILDTLDIDYLMYFAQRHYDMTFKSRFIELSQNVDRDTDSRQWGIVSCLTPSGMPWDSRRGGPVFGKEALALQGIPVDNLSLNRETSRQLQDLAGNAMTTTVIGSIVFSAIVASCVELVENTDSQNKITTVTSMFEEFDSDSTVQKAVQKASLADIANICPDHNMRKVQLHPQDTSVSVDSIKHLAASTLPICKCDDVTSSDIIGFECASCGHTACSRCAGNPAHDYKVIPAELLKLRQNPELLMQMLEKALPPSLMVQMAAGTKDFVLQILAHARRFNEHDIKPDVLDPPALTTDEAQRYQRAVLNAFNNPVYMNAIKRECLWRIIFESNTARIELRLTPHEYADASKMLCQWLLYAKPDQDELSASIVRDLLSRPIARMEPQGSDILKGTWQLWDPSMIPVYLDVQGSGKPQPSWEQKLGTQYDVFRDLKVFPLLKVRMSETGNEMLDSTDRTNAKKLCGDYKWLSDCGTACGSLHARNVSGSSNTDTKYMFLDPNPLQNAYLDRIVIADFHSRLPYGVKRLTAAEFAKAWRPNSLRVKADFEPPIAVPCRLIDKWHSIDGVEFGLGMQSHIMAFWTPSDDNRPSAILDCDITLPILLAKLPTRDIPQPHWHAGIQYPIKVAGQPAALKDFQWLLKRLSQDIQGAQGSLTWNESSPDCPDCAPVAPLLEWHHTRNRTGNKAVIKPFEDTYAATTYERSLLNRAVLITATVHAHQDHALLVVKLNLNAAAHRLNGKLPLLGSHNLITWRLVYNDSLDAYPVFTPLRLSDKDQSQSVWPAGDLMYANQLAVTKPQLFERQLWDSQRKALSWMLENERGLGWTGWDAEICDAPALNLQLRVDADVKQLVHGGIVADEVGAGKTTTSLALVARGLEELPPYPQIPRPNLLGKIRSRATLILVPENIMNQWMEQIEACFGKRWTVSHVLKIEKNKEPRPLRSMQQADIILATWQHFSQDSYWLQLGQICCAPYVPTKSPRAFRQWLDEVCQDTEDIVTECGPNLDVHALKQYRSQRKAEKKKKYMRFEVFQKKNTNADESRQKELKERAADLKKNGPQFAHGAIEADVKAAEKDFEELYAWKVGNTIPALLHFFEFQRVIVDEFTYPDAQELLAIRKLTAMHKWMLSGTPPLTSAESINCMATLIGSQISCEKETDMAFNFKDARSVGLNEKTYAEEFREQIEKRSPAWIQTRNERCQRFVDLFIRQHKSNKVTVRKFTQYIVVPQSALEACIYNRAFQRVKGQPLRFGSKKKIVQKPDDVFFQMVLESAASIEEALLSCHANFTKRYSKSSDKEAIDSFVTEAQQNIDETYKGIVKSLREAFWYWHQGQAKDDTEADNPHLVTYLSSILSKAFGDSSISNLMVRTTAYARARPLQPLQMAGTKKVPEAYDPTVKHDPNKRRKELQDRATELNEKTMRLVEQAQLLRLLHNIRDIVGGNSSPRCACCKLFEIVGKQTILGQCGHVVCDSCLANNPQASSDIGGCPVKDCAASIKDCRVPAKIYDCASNSSPQTTSSFGSKLDALVATIQSIDTNDYIIIFIQFEAHRTQLTELLKSRRIDFEDGTRNPTRSIEAFRKARSVGFRVLILRIDSADSAGWNLEKANHVMFVTPFLARTQYDWDATMTQAVGRALRFGQRKDVTVYHFLSARSADVNIIQARTGKRLVQLDNDQYALVDPTSELAGDQEDLAGPSLDADSVALVDDEARADRK